MCVRGTKLVGVIAVLVAILLSADVAGAKSADPTRAKETKASKQASPGGKVEAKAGTRPKEARGKREASGARGRDLDRKTQDLQRDLETQRQAEKDSRVRLEESAKAAYKGEDIAGVTLVLNSILSGDGAKFDAILGGPVGRVLTRGRESVEFRRDSQRALRDTIRQLDQKKKSSKARERAEEQRGGLVVSVGGSSVKREQTEYRISELEAADEAGFVSQPPASGSGGAGPLPAEQELDIAQEDIVAIPVEPIPYEKYVKIYKDSAKRYGFERDWYVLAAVGKVESDHGENVGPSSAGAMGPMQFLPSTWQAYGIDGNEDGVANIMDPEDAIPAAAGYLKEGGAPDDWEAALYVYNHAGWYVRKVLGVAEGYRQHEKDDEVEPYA